MRKPIQVVSFLLSLMSLFLCSIAAAQPVSGPETAEIKRGAIVDKRIGEKMPKALNDKKAEEQVPVKRMDRKSPDMKPIQDAPVVRKKLVDTPPKLVPKDKIQPVKDDAHVQSKPLMESRPLKHELEVNQKPKLKKKNASKLDDCRIDREACRQDCKAEKKECGKSKSCSAAMRECKKNCTKKIICH